METDRTHAFAYESTIASYGEFHQLHETVAIERLGVGGIPEGSLDQMVNVTVIKVVKGRDRLG